MRTVSNLMSSYTKHTEFYRTINSPNEKVEVRTYKCGLRRCYIYQGDRWWPMEMEIFKQYRAKGIIYEDEN